jgi:hypothetical protein
MKADREGVAAGGARVDGSAVAEGVFDNGQGGEHLGQPGSAASDSGCVNSWLS